MLGWLAILALTTAASGTPAFAQEDGATRLRYGSTGREAPYFYHQLSGGCDFLMHAFGRNAAWGSWRLPLAEVSAGEVSPASTGDGSALVRFECTDGSACIGTGRLSAITGAASTHDIPFETMDGARAFLTRLTSLRESCSSREGA